MQPLHSKQDVIALASRFAPTRACQRAMEEQGRIEVFRVPSLPGWVVEVVGGTYLRAWWIAVRIDEALRTYKFSYPEALPSDAVKIEGNRL